ncbi:hypothetical protein J6590_060711 [Homalodisca vitripennis]|nr:hypothetical protein J6590_060711 [Homalodisca vitripennis]
MRTDRQKSSKTISSLHFSSRISTGNGPYSNLTHSKYLVTLEAAQSDFRSYFQKRKKSRKAAIGKSFIGNVDGFIYTPKNFADHFEGCDSFTSLLPVPHRAPPQVADRGTLTRYGGYRGNKIPGIVILSKATGRITERKIPGPPGWGFDPKKPNKGPRAWIDSKAMSERNLGPGDWNDRREWKLGIGRRPHTL